MKYNFASGPTTLPKEVVSKITKDILNFDNTGLSILETYHRSKNFIDILKKAKEELRDLLKINDSYEILFLHGGASLQFVMIPYNFLDSSGTAAFVDTGLWAQKAMAQASKFGKVAVIGSSKHKDYTYIPKKLKLPTEKCQYIYICSNNSVYGTGWNTYPDYNIPLIADMTSDILTKKIDINKFALIYASLQKNIGIAGGSVVIINKVFLKSNQVKRVIPDMLDYKIQVEAESIYNTPPVFSIYVAYLMLNWLKEQGGIDLLEQNNLKKAYYLYDYIDSSKIFFNNVDINDRSTTNVVFKLKDKNLERDFINFAAKNNCLGIQGHRSIGGFRVSLYNSITFEAVEHLVKVMQVYEKRI